MATLTERDRVVLHDISRACGEFDGYMPHGAGQWITVRRLVRFGLAESIGIATCHYGDCRQEHEAEGFRLTVAGELVNGGGA